MVAVRQITLDGYDGWGCRATKMIKLPKFSVKAIKDFLEIEGPAEECGMELSKTGSVITAMHEEGGDVFVLIS